MITIAVCEEEKSEEVIPNHGKFDGRWHRPFPRLAPTGRFYPSTWFRGYLGPQWSRCRIQSYLAYSASYPPRKHPQSARAPSSRRTSKSHTRNPPHPIPKSGNETKRHRRSTAYRQRSSPSYSNSRCRLSSLPTALRASRTARGPSALCAAAGGPSPCRSFSLDEHIPRLHRRGLGRALLRADTAEAGRVSGALEAATAKHHFRPSGTKRSAQSGNCASLSSLRCTASDGRRLVSPGHRCSITTWTVFAGSFPCCARWISGSPGALRAREGPLDIFESCPRLQEASVNAGRYDGDRPIAVKLPEGVVLR
ncbi:hypothetical protein B0H13DRAFT_267994 [Mycena leptocephala]|nr:hypothetical protein B0H13DRAFT_267994 [Mycena leptocephala]